LGVMPAVPLKTSEWLCGCTVPRGVKRRPIGGQERGEEGKGELWEGRGEKGGGEESVLLHRRRWLWGVESPFPKCNRAIG
jgi:hypothetical protein